jgi:ubiquinone/menaquinone biosynthesis C-methylase UbiE
MWLIRTFFRLLYGQFAWAYDAVAWLVSLGQWTAWGRASLPFLRGPRVLELGHGPGHLQLTIGASGLRAVAVDLSPQMGRLARRRLARAGLTPRLVRARAQALPFRSDAFDSLVATFPTEYIVARRTLHEARRVMTGEGRLVVVASARLVGGDLAARFLEWLYRITGQRQPVPAEDDPRLSGSGLALRFQWVPAYRSQVLVVIGEKRAPARGDGTSEYGPGLPSEGHIDPGKA